VEALTSIFKHNFPQARSGTIWITLRRPSKTWLKLSLEHNGACPEDGDGIGPRLLHIFGRQLGGEVSSQCDKARGRRVALSFPLPQQGQVSKH